MYSPERFHQLVEEFAERENRILGWKAGEYSDGTDRLQNFREIAVIEGREPVDVALTLLLKHIQSIAHHVKIRKFAVWAWQTESGEGLKQRFADARNYLLLLAACVDEISDFTPKKEREG